VLDVEVDPRGDIHVYRLKNTLAVEMQGVLEEIGRGQQQTGGSRRPPGTTGGTTPSLGIDQPAQVVADEASNSLIITASKTKYAELIEVIKMLDIRRRQVLIEAAVVELKSDLSTDLGVELAGLDLKVDADGNLISDYYYIQFNEGEGTPMMKLITLCQDVTGYAIQYNEADVQDIMIHIIGKQRIRKSETGFFEYFQSVLISYEFICAPYGPEEDPFFITIKKMSSSAAGRGTELFKAQAPVIPLEEIEKYKDNPGRLITTTFQLEHIESRQAITSLNPYFPNQQLETIRPVENSNSLIITAFANKVYYITKLVKLMDVEPKEVEAEFIKRELNYAVAEELEPVLTQLTAAARNLRPGAPTKVATQGTMNEPEPKIIAEPRTNSLLITGTEKMIDKISQWVDVLDVEVDPRGDIHVYRLKNTLAVEMQGVLEEIGRGQQQTGGSRRPPGTTGGTTPSLGIDQPAQVVADEASNSLIITASKTKYAELIEVIKMLDIRRRQVLIEAAVVELKSDLSTDLGVELAGLDLKVDADGNLISDDYTRPFGFTSFDLSTIEGDPETGYQRIPNIGSGFTGGIFNGQDFAIPFLLSTLSSSSTANILSMPSILTNDNEEATIEALDEAPTFSRTENTSGSSTEAFQGYEEAGIILQISPSISAGNYLKLQVDIQVSSFLGDAQPPPKSRRQIKTSVTIPDGHTMIIGGVITDDLTEAETKIPFLGDLPLLGWLFRYTSESTRKVNLYVFITPHIIGDDFANLDNISFRKKKEVEVLRGDVILIDPDFEETNADARVLDAGANWIFEIPSYAEPDTGETSKDYIKPKGTEADPYRTGDL